MPEDIYGKYVFERHRGELFSEDHTTRVLVPVIAHHLECAGLIQGLRELDVMDVGMGRQALALSQLGAKSVAHFDISPRSVELLREFIGSRGAYQNITSCQFDLCKDKLPECCIDFLYLNGVVQHLADVKTGLDNCISALREGAKFWIMFYRSGAFRYFVLSMIRKILHADDLSLFVEESAKLEDSGAWKSATLRYFIDDCFTPYVWYFSPIEYIDFMRASGFRFVAVTT